MNDQPPNPLDLIQAHLEDIVPRQHSSGRRELRYQLLNGRRVWAAAAGGPESPAAQDLGATTAPIRRREPKRPAGVSARQWKRMVRERRRAIEREVEAHETAVETIQQVVAVSEQGGLAQ